MGLFKEVKKPVIKQSVSGSADVSSLRPAYTPKTAPCIRACVCGTDVRGWLVPLAQHKDYGRTPEQAFEVAWRKILENNPFPAICGRVCQHPCELNCNRKAKDGSVSVRRLEQFVGDFAISHGWRAQPATEQPGAGTRIAVVGAGPAGLSATYHLACKGFAVTLIEAAPQPGGMMRYRIPRSVIPSEVLDGEIASILSLGIDLRANCVVGRDVSVEQLQHDYAAVFFAMGLQKPAQLEVRGGRDGEAVLAGALPAEPPQIPAQEALNPEPRTLNTVSVAIAQGRAVAETLAAQFECCAVHESWSPAVIHAEKIKLDWYPAAAQLASGTTALSEAEVIAEAARCMSCGMCMDCETCWMYCSKNCFEKLPKGEHYKIKLDLCNGCGKCAESCPCGYIEMN